MQLRRRPVVSKGKLWLELKGNHSFLFGFKKFSLVTTLLPVFDSSSFLAFLAIAPPFFARHSVFIEPFGLINLCDLSRGKFSQGREKQFGFIHVVSQVLRF